jgi:hypothetical protein
MHMPVRALTQKRGRAGVIVSAVENARAVGGGDWDVAAKRLLDGGIGLKPQG